MTIAADQYDRLMTHLEHFIIMDDVELTPLSEESALGLAGPLAADMLARLSLPTLAERMTSERAEWKGEAVRVVRGYDTLAPHYELWVGVSKIPALWQALVEAGATPVGAEMLEAFRIAEGIPAYGIDIAERDLPQEVVPQTQVALSFNKGCYLGQEIVERIRSRGSVHRHLRPLELYGPVPAAGAELKLEGEAIAGQITSAAALPLASSNRIFALGMMRGEAELHNQQFFFTVGNVTGTAHILTAPPMLGAG